MFNRRIALVAVTLMVGAMALPAKAQPAPADNGNGNTNNGGGNNGGGGNGGGRGGGRRNGGGGGNGGGQNGGGPGGGPGGGFAAFAAQRMQQLKTDMGATDEEFTALQPKIEKITQLKQELNPRGGGRGGFGGGRRGAAAADPNAAAPAQTDLQKALAELQAAIQNKDTPADTLKAKLDAYHTAKAATEAELKKDQDDLKSVVTQRQEAVLVVNGTLE